MNLAQVPREPGPDDGKPPNPVPSVIQGLALNVIAALIVLWAHDHFGQTGVVILAVVLGALAWRVKVTTGRSLPVLRARWYWLASATALAAVLGVAVHVGPSVWGPCGDSPGGESTVPILGGDFPGRASITEPESGCVSKIEDVEISLPEVPESARVWLLNSLDGQYWPYPDCGGRGSGTAVRRDDDQATARVQIGDNTPVEGVYELLVLVTDANGDKRLTQLTNLWCATSGWKPLSSLDLPAASEIKASVRVVRRPNALRTLKTLFT